MNEMRKTTTNYDNYRRRGSKRKILEIGGRLGKLAPKTCPRPAQDYVPEEYTPAMQAQHSRLRGGVIMIRARAYAGQDQPTSQLGLSDIGLLSKVGMKVPRRHVHLVVQLAAMDVYTTPVLFDSVWNLARAAVALDNPAPIHGGGR